MISDLKQSNIEDNIALEVQKRIEQLGVVVGTSEYKAQYSDLMGFVSNHVTVLGFLSTLYCYVNKLFDIKFNSFFLSYR